MTAWASAASMPVPGFSRAPSRLQAVASRREFVQPGDPVNPKAIVDGWVGGFVVLDDGRRQVVDLFLPGETLAPRAPQPKWHIGLKALTPTRLSSEHNALLAEPDDAPSHYLYQTNAILRLGCLSAYERLGHFFLEMSDRIGRYRTGPRLWSDGDSQGGIDKEAPRSIVFPLTQEIMADLLGMSAVHINRTLQQLRRNGMVILGGGRLTLPEPDKLARTCHYNLDPLPVPRFGRQPATAVG